jgi:hypothetical protein
MRKRMIRLFSMVVLSAVLLSACFGTIPSTPTPTPVPPDTSAANDDNSVQPEPPAANPPEKADAADQSEGEPDKDSVEEEQEAAALPSLPELGYAYGASQLKATDPNQVDLTSGKIHLVELFAFW